MGHILRYGIPELNLHFEKDIHNYRKELVNVYLFKGIQWVPNENEWYRECSASDYSWLLTIFIRINGAARIAESFKEVVKRERALREKLQAFIDNHVQLAVHINSLDIDIYSDDEIGIEHFNRYYKPMGKTRYKDDVLIMKRTYKLLPMSETPTEVFRRTFADLGLGFSVLLKDDPLEHTIQKIEKMSNEQISEAYLNEDNPPFPDYCPYMPRKVDQIRAMMVYTACLEIIQEINTTYLKVESLKEKDPEASNCVLFALQKYKAAFAPLMFYMLNYEKGAQVGALDDRVADAHKNGGVESTPLDMWYPWPTTSLHCGDLPNLNHTLSSIALWGSQDIKEKVPIVRTMIKSLPFCCQRRKLIHNISENCMEESYWRAFSSFFWCTLSGLYPWAENRPGMCGLIRAQYMCENKEVMLDALRKEGEINKGLAQNDRTNHTCRIVFTVFREYFLYMAGQNQGYVDVATQRMNWDEFKEETIRLGNELRRSIRLEHAADDDPFHYARPAMEKAGGSSKSKVHRFRKHPFPKTIQEKSDEILDEIYVARKVVKSQLSVLRAAQVSEEIPLDTLRRLPLFREAEAEIDPSDDVGFSETIGKAIRDTEGHQHLFEYELPAEIKVNIINYLLRLSPPERLRFDALLDPSLGGVSRAAVHVLHRCYEIYQMRSAPKDLRAQLKSVKFKDQAVINWYFNILTKIERISLMPLDAETTERINYAMRTQRFCMHPMEELPADAFKVYYTLCCGTIKSMPVAEKPQKKAQRIFGTIEVSYNPAIKNYVCVKKVKKTPQNGAKRRKTDDGGSGADSEVPLEALLEPTMDKKLKTALSKEATKERKRMNTLPCKDQPVLGIDIYGYALMITASDGKGTTRVQHCPRCATLHVYKHEYWGPEGYLCEYCTEESQVCQDVQRCAACQVMAKKGSTMTMVDVVRSEVDPHDEEWNQYDYPLSCYETLYFCRKHSYNARKDGYRGVTKEFMIPHVHTAAQRRKMYNIIKYQ